MRTLKLSGLAALTVALGVGACSKTTYETPAPSASTGSTTVTTTTTATADTTTKRDTTMGYAASGTATTSANAGTAAGTTSTTVTTTTGAAGTTSASGTMSTGATAGAQTLALESVNNSGFTGNVTITDLGSKTRIALTLNAPANTKASSDHNAAIHTGTCAAPGPKVIGLHDVEGNGKASDTEVDLLASQIMNGQHIIVARENPGDRAVACVAIPSK